MMELYRETESLLKETRNNSIQSAFEVKQPRTRKNKWVVVLLRQPTYSDKVQGCFTRTPWAGCLRHNALRCKVCEGNDHSLYLTPRASCRKQPAQTEGVIPYFLKVFWLAVI